MSTPAGARYTFLPWVRQGIGAGLATVDGEAVTLADRATLDVEIRANAEPFAPVSVSVYGPGDVTGFDQRQVVRTEPRAGSGDFEPNYLAAIEFDRPDFPWMFTPARAKGDRLRPWICLVVVPRDKAGVALAQGANGRAVLSLDEAAAELPDLGESWLWAHSQVAGVAAGETLASLLAHSHDRNVSRLVCPRRLQASTAYLACVVPTFEAGRRAGLGRAAQQAESSLGPAWTATTKSLELPLYYHWGFSTGPEGDFETLARKLQAAPPAPDAGRVEVDVADGGSGLPRLDRARPGAVLPFEGALLGRGGPAPAWPEPGKATLEAGLRKRLDAPAEMEAEDPSLPGVVGPPVYGGLHAGRRTVPTDRPTWLRQLNLDPRWRIAAGLGTRVVQAEQEELMASAWEQIGAVEEANRLLRQAQLARQAGLTLFARHFEQLQPGALLQITQTVQSRLQNGSGTIAQAVRESAVADAVLQPAFRRIARPRGPLARRARPEAGSRFALGTIVERLNRGELSAAPPRRAPDGSVLASDLEGAAPSSLPGPLGRRRRRLVLRLLGAAVGLLLAALVAPGPIVALLLLAAAAALLALAALIWLRGRKEDRGEGEGGVGPDAEAVMATPPRPDFRPLGPGEAPPDAPPAAGDGDSAEAIAFRAAAARKQRELEAIAAVPSPRPQSPLPLGQVRETLLGSLDPSVTVPPALLARISTPAGWEPEDPIEPIMAAPEFPTPMYEPLARLFKNMFFPGVEDVAMDSATVLSANGRLIDAYMVGLNHEMGRELLWREYPTDQRGTYFRQFWDPRGHVPQPRTEAERRALEDIDPIHAWRSRWGIGDAFGSRHPEGVLILLLRGQLLRRYPNAVVYAAKADRRPEQTGRAPVNPPKEPGDERHPILIGQIEPDITFVGFDMSIERARGGPAPTGGKPDPGPGYFFVLAEQPTEPRFGFDEGDGTAEAPTKFDDLDWEDVVLENGHVDVGATAATAAGAITGPGGLRWGSHAGAMAYIALQKPYRVAISGDDMLGEA